MHGLNLLVLVARRHLLRALQCFLSLDRHFFESQHSRSSHPRSEEKGPARKPALLCFHNRLLVYFAPAAAAIAGAPTLTLICFGFASSRFGMVNVKTPFCYS